MGEIRANRVPDDLLREIDIECARRGRLSIREATIQAFQQWLSKVSKPQPEAPEQPAPTPLPHRHAEYHAMLDVILDHGQEADVTGIQANLRWGSESVQRRRKPVEHHRKASNG
jgi:hypothetical protein